MNSQKKSVRKTKTQQPKKKMLLKTNLLLVAAILLLITATLFFVQAQESSPDDDDEGAPATEVEINENPLTQEEIDKMVAAIEREQSEDPKFSALAKLEAFAYRTRHQLANPDILLGELLQENDRLMILMTLEGALDLVTEHPDASAEQLDLLRQDVVAAVNSLIVKVYDAENFNLREEIKEFEVEDGAASLDQE